MSEVERLRQQAAKAFRLATASNDPKARTALEEIGHELMAQAADLESQANEPSN